VFSSSAPKRGEVQQDREAAAFEMDSITLPAVEREKELLRKM